MTNLSAFRKPDGSWHYRGFTIDVDPEGRYFLGRERGARLPLMTRHASLDDALREVDEIFAQRSEVDPVGWAEELMRT